MLADDLLITVTSFFRDPQIFEKLQKDFIPKIFARKDGNDELRVWVPGCATGEEAYSLVILLIEEMARHELPPRIQVFASDLHEASLERAREGYYPGDIESDVSSERLRRFFIKENGGYRIRKEVRELVIFAPHNLLGDPPFLRLDLISCRNLLIYLQREVQREVMELFHYALRADGILVVGTSEAVDDTDLFVTNMIERQERQLSRLIDDLLDVSRITQGKIRLRTDVVDLRRVVEEAIELHRHQIERREQELGVAMPDREVYVEGDAMRLQQAVGNLVHNASKFSAPGSRIEVRGAVVDDEAVIEVADQGIGMADGLAERAFDLFVQGEHSLARSEGGLGVGLTTVKRLVEMHGGTVAVFSEGLNQGSLFRIRLPLSPTLPATPATATDPAQPPAAASPPRARRILVVEDNVDTADALSEYLRLAGHRCWTANGGVDALALFAKHHPDLVLLDIGLPDIDGFEVAERIRASPAGHRAVVVALTGYGEEEVIDRALGNGFDRHFLKPIEPAQLDRLLAETAEP